MSNKHKQPPKRNPARQDNQHAPVFKSKRRHLIDEELERLSDEEIYEWYGNES